MAKDIAVSVVMAVYNDAKYLEESIPSILRQSLRNLEFIIVDDGSTDESVKVIQHYASRDDRITLVRNTTNLGLASSLNKGFSLATGEFIARMDADDISRPKRLQTQFEFLRSHPSVGMCGSCAQLFGHRGGWLMIPKEHEEIRASLLFYNAICHPSVMIRKSAIEGLGALYESGRRRAEDLELWSRIVEVLKVQNLQKRLIKYRLHDPKSLAKREAVVSHGNEIRVSLLRSLMGEISPENFALHMKMVRCERNHSFRFVDEAADWLESILDANERTKVYDQNALEKVASYRWWRVCRASTEFGPKILLKFYSRKRLLRKNLGALRIILFWWKCLFWHKNGASSIHDSELAFISKLPDTP